MSSVGFDNGPATDSGRVFGFFGVAGGLATTAARTETGASPGEQFGLCMATGGDINGDGYADHLIGAPKFVSGQTDEGAFYANDGGTVGFLISAFPTTQMNMASSRLGFSPQTAGDVDGDGSSHVIVSAPSFDGSGINRDGVMVYLGDVDYPTSVCISFSQSPIRRVHHSASPRPCRRQRRRLPGPPGRIAQLEWRRGGWRSGALLARRPGRRDQPGGLEREEPGDRQPLRLVAGRRGGCQRGWV